MRSAISPTKPLDFPLDRRALPIGPARPSIVRASRPSGTPVAGTRTAIDPARPAWTRRLHAAWYGVCRAMTARRDAAHLRGLPDYLLRDIGLTRCEIERVCASDGLERLRRVPETF